MGEALDTYDQVRACLVRVLQAELDHVSGQVWTMVRDQVSEHLWVQVSRRVYDQVENRVYNQIAGKK